MLIQNKSFKLANLNTEPESGIVEAIVSVFNNVDSVKDRIRPGFFQKSLTKKLPKGVWMHDWKQPVSKTLEARELAPGDPMLPAELKDLGGLYIKGQFNLDTQRGKEAFSDVKFGLVDEFSIGYSVEKQKYDSQTKVNDLIEGELYEWSPVLVGANRSTMLLSAKGFEGNQNENDDDEPEVSAKNINSLLAGLKFDEQFELVLAAVEELKNRATSIKQLREKEGRKFSTTNRSRITRLVNELNALHTETEETPEPAPEPTPAPTVDEGEKAAKLEARKKLFEAAKKEADRRLAQIKQA